MFQHALHHMARSTMPSQLRSEGQQLVEHFSTALLRTMLQEVLNDKVAVLVSTKICCIRYELVDQTPQLLLRAMLDQPLQDAATEAMPRNHQVALLDDLMDDGAQRSRWHYFDGLCQHVISMWRLIERHRVWAQLSYQGFAATSSNDFEQFLDYSTAARRCRQLDHILADPFPDLLAIDKILLQHLDDLFAQLCVLGEVLGAAIIVQGTCRLADGVVPLCAAFIAPILEASLPGCCAGRDGLEQRREGREVVNERWRSVSLPKWQAVSRAGILCTGRWGAAVGNSAFAIASAAMVTSPSSALATVHLCLDLGAIGGDVLSSRLLDW
mmetsp:Transcript_813/g.1824  ORF Transcript_813/g.1824 Transcript_813/m.1824 type:complete len:326 (-) Transcript_813:328-1305(-)